MSHGLRIGGLACAFLCLTGVGTSPARAQEAIGAGIAENLAAGRSATDFNTRIRVRTGYWNTANDTKLVPTRLSGTWAPRPSLALRLQLPLLYRDPVGSNGEFGTSDLSARVLWRAWEHPKATAFVGLELFFPTASDPTLGTEKYSLSPIAAAFVPITTSNSSPMRETTIAPT